VTASASSAIETDVLEQAAAVGVVHRLGRRVLAEPGAVDLEGVGGEPTQHRPPDLGERPLEAAPEIVDVLAGGRDQPGLVEAEASILLGDLAAVVDRQLQLVAIELDAAPQGDEVVGVEVGLERGAVGPHLGDHRAGGVADLHVEVGTGVAVLAQLLAGDQDEALDAVARLPGGDRLVLAQRHVAGSVASAGGGGKGVPNRGAGNGS
jgi:hypothetical protein